MSQENDDKDVIDRSALANLRELQEEGEPDIVAEVGGLFLKHTPDKISAIEQATEKGDAKGLQIAAHSLESSSAYVAAMRLSAMSKELEQMGRSGELKGAKELVELLKAECLRVVAALKAEIKSTDTSQA